MTTFNLVDEKWIPVFSKTSVNEVLSLKELLASLTSYKEIVSENSGTDLAIYRFLFSLYLAKDTSDTVIEYIEKNTHFFDILDPHIPFFQDPNILESAAGQVYQAEKIHGSNTSTVGCHEHEWSRYTIDLAAGARLLLRLQLFDVGGRKTGATLSAGQMPCVGIDPMEDYENLDISSFVSEWNRAKKAAILAGFDGFLRRPAAVSWVPDVYQGFVPLFIFKEDSSGATFVVSSIELPWLKKIAINSSYSTL
jgi:CRISPR-associated protein Cse1 (CRISPR_cse1)